MRSHRRLIFLVSLLLTAALLFSSCSATALETAKKRRNTPVPTAVPEATAAPADEPTAEPGPREAAQQLADYLFEHGELPENFVTKREAQDLGWKTRYRNVGDIRPGLAIGGDYFGNYEGKLPQVRGRKYYEADCFYQGKERNAYRIIWSTDGHVWYTGDHYETFEELFPSGN